MNGVERGLLVAGDRVREPDEAGEAVAVDGLDRGQRIADLPSVSTCPIDHTKVRSCLVQSMIVTGVDFVSVPTQDLERAVAFYGETLGLERSVYKPQHGFAEFETGTVTLNVHDPKQMGIGEFNANKNHIALQVADVAEARSTLEERGVAFMGDIVDTGVCHMAFLADPDGNMLMLHHRYSRAHDRIARRRAGPAASS